MRLGKRFRDPAPDGVDVVGLGVVGHGDRNGFVGAKAEIVSRGRDGRSNVRGLGIGADCEIVGWRPLVEGPHAIDVRRDEHDRRPPPVEPRREMTPEDVERLSVDVAIRPVHGDHPQDEIAIRRLLDDRLELLARPARAPGCRSEALPGMPSRSRT